MDMLRRRLLPPLRWVLGYGDALLAIGLAVAFSILAALNKIEGDALFQATGGLLAVLALMLIRERWERREVIASVQDLIALSSAAKSFEVRSGSYTWDLDGPDASMARAINRKELRILGTEVVSIYEYFSSDGDVGVTTYRGARKGEPKRELPVMSQEFPGPEGRNYRIISLEGIYMPGDVFELESTREIIEGFHGPRDKIVMNITNPVEALVMTVRWPAECKPTMLRLERTGRPPESVDPGRIRTKDGKPQYSWDPSGLKLNEKLVMVWEWDLA